MIRKGPWDNSEEGKKFHKAYNKEYREKHKEELERKRKEYYKKNKGKLNPYAAKWRKSHRPQINEYTKTFKHREREELRKLIGSSCCICGSTTTICYHEIHGKFHIKGNRYYREHYMDFVPLCRSCHRLLHILHRDRAKFSPLLNKLGE